MPWGAAIGAVAAVGSAVISSSASGSASSAQQGEDQASIAQQKAEQQQQQYNEAPYLETGAGALAQLSSLYGIQTPNVPAVNASAVGYAWNQGAPGAAANTNAAGGGSTVNPDASFYLSPDYNFALTQGLKGITASGAATNGTDNGATDKAEIAYAGNLASSQYSNYVSNLQNLAGVGQDAAAEVNTATGATSANASKAETTAGSNQAAADLGEGTTEVGALNNLAASSTQYLNSGPSVASSYLNPSNFAMNTSGANNNSGLGGSY
jgi:hypothetical protein